MRKVTVGVVITGGAVAALGLAVAPASSVTSQPAASSGDKAPVIKFRGFKKKITVSQEKVTPGVVRFKVVKTYDKSPAGPDSLAVVSSDHIGKALQQLPKIIGNDPQEAAHAAKQLRKLSTLYSGGPDGTVWEADLAPGKYYVVSVLAGFSGNPIKTKFKVKGVERSTPLHTTAGSIEAAKPNVWKTSGLSHSEGKWISFRNTSKEIHFVDLQGVKKDTTKSDVAESFMNPGPPPSFTNKRHYSLEVLSPGYSVVFKSKVHNGKYLLACYVPSETDGTPHAFMGMWKLVKFH